MSLSSVFKGKKIKVLNAIVEMDGDEMARVMWRIVKQKLIVPFCDLHIEYFDLGIEKRNETDDAVTTAAVAAIRKHGVGVKCATITPDAGRVAEFGLKRIFPSPNATIRGALGGTLFREPVPIRTIPALISSWRHPIVVARHAFGDQYAALDVCVDEPGHFELLFVPKGDGAQKPVRNFGCIGAVGEAGGVALGMFNDAARIRDFAHACFSYALQRGYPLILSTKNTILPRYDGAFKRIFDDVFADSYADRFAALRPTPITYSHRLIDDAVAAAVKATGPFVWALKNYDGDVQSDFVAQGFGSLSLMTSVLLTGDGQIVLSEAAHGTVTRHFRQFVRGQSTSTNPVATVFAWSRALQHRARLDSNAELGAFSRILEEACVETVASDGVMTRDLAVAVAKGADFVPTEAFVEHVAGRLVRTWSEKCLASDDHVNGDYSRL